jgi:hypothetical protein
MAKTEIKTETEITENEVQLFENNFPDYGVTIWAEDHEHALQILKETLAK